MKNITQYQQKLQLEYSRTRKSLIRKLSKSSTSNNTKALIREAIRLLTARQSRVMAYYISKSFLAGIKDAKNEIKGVKLIRAAAPMAEISFDLSSISDTNLRKIVRSNIGAIGKYNVNLSQSLIKQYDELLSDNKLLTSLNRHGYSPWLDGALLKRGIAPAVISLVKGQKTTAKMLTILNNQGMHGGMHPDQVARRLIPHINRYFGPNGVEINNIGKVVKQFRIDADGNYGWFDHKITRKYHTTARNYSRLIAQSSMKEARRDAYYNSVQKTGLVDHYISVSVMDARTCGNCAMMHGQIISHAEGPSYHPRCHCDLRPVWKRNSILGDKNKPDIFYEKQRNMHFLRMHDLKRLNNTLPAGSKLKNYAMLPKDALSMIMPGPLQMVKIRHALMGEPAKIAPRPPIEMAAFSEEQWQTEAKTLYAKTAKDNVEHMRIYTPDGAIKDFEGTPHGCEFVSPKGKFNSLHTHPSSWDSPLSDVDMSSFLASKGEIQMGATSRDTIYVVTKNKGYKALTQMQRVAFENEFQKEVNRLFYLIDTSKYSNTDYHNVYLSAGKMMAKRYGVEYKVISR